MARAKRTGRADARRRHRAVNPIQGDAFVGADDASEGSSPASKAPLATKAPRSAPNSDRSGRSSGSPPRQGFMGTLRHAAARPNVVEDIRALPRVALHSKALWLPLLLILVSAILFFIPGLQRNPLVTMVGQIALTPPPMIMPFLGGMLAPRAAWLVGGIIGLANAFGFLVLVVVNTNSQVTPLGWTYVVTSDAKIAYAISAIMSAVPFGILVGAFAGFYRRFLSASSPARQPARPNARRR